MVNTTLLSMSLRVVTSLFNGYQPGEVIPRHALLPQFARHYITPLATVCRNRLSREINVTVLSSLRHNGLV